MKSARLARFCAGLHHMNLRAGAALAYRDETWCRVIACLPERVQRFSSCQEALSVPRGAPEAVRIALIG